MSERLEAKKTPVSPTEVFVALWCAWLNMFGTSPQRDSLLLLVAHWALETGWGKSLWCYNLGNAKSSATDGRDFCYFGCGEEIPLAMAEDWVKRDPTLVRVVRVYLAGTVHMASVWVDPDHFAARFRAFKTLEEGAVDYLAMIRKRFSAAWPFVCAGDPVGFVHAIKQQGYFTASEAPYAASVRTIFSGLQASLHVDISALPVLSDEQAKKIMDLVALTSQELGEELRQELKSDHGKEED